ncbi:MAG: sensor histidine kinase [Lacipirellulaceae bacterium]
MSALRNPSHQQDRNEAAPSPPPLALYRPDEQSPPVELADLLEAWGAATERLERTHAQLRDEVARLTSELEVKNRELARKNRLADLGEMASHVAHEVRNSLTPVTLYLSLLRRRLVGDAAALGVLSKAEAGFTALEATVNDLLSFSTHRHPQWNGFLVGDMIDEVCDSLAPQFDAQGVEVEIDVPPNTVLVGDRELLRRAVLNLVLNALDVMPRGGELVITSYQNGRGFELEVADSGPGLTDEQKQRVFEPFYSTKETGTGLGLSVVAHVAEAHGGHVTAANCPEGGAAFTVYVPRRTAGAAA